MAKRRELTIWHTGENVIGGNQIRSFQRFPTPLRFKPIQIAAGNKHILVLEENGQLWVAGSGKEGQLGLGPNIIETKKLERIVIPKLQPYSKSKKKKEEQNEEKKEEEKVVGKDPMLCSTIRRRFDSLRKINDKVKKEVIQTEEEDVIISIESGPIICGAITKSGKILIWGRIFQETIYYPKVLTLWYSLQVVQMSIGNQHGIILCKTPNSSSHVILTWGRSSSGALGLGEKEIVSLQPRQLKYFDHLNPLFVNAGANSSAVITEEGNLYIWGNTGLKVDFTPKKVNLNPVSGALLGDRFNFAIKDKNLYSWGNGYMGVLGHGDNEDRSDPTIVRLFNPSTLGNIAKISCAHSHAAFCTDRGLLYTMGNGDSGALGNQTELSSIIPFFVINTGFVRSVACSSRSTFILCEKETQQMSLGMLMENEQLDIPLYIHHLLTALLSNNRLLSEGIFLTPGDQAQSQEIAQFYANYSKQSQTQFDFEPVNPYTLSSLLYRFLSGLPEPIFPNFQANFRPMQVKFNNNNNNNIISEGFELGESFPDQPLYKKLIILHNFLQTLPTINWNLSRRLLSFLYQVVDNSSYNRLDLRKVASLFSKVFFHANYDDQLQISILSSLIPYSHLVFLSKDEFLPLLVKEMHHTENYFGDLSDFMQNYLSENDLIQYRSLFIDHLLHRAIMESLTKSIDENWFVIEFLLSICLPKSVTDGVLQSILSNLKLFRDRDLDPISKGAISGAITLLCSLDDQFSDVFKYLNSLFV